MEEEEMLQIDNKHCPETNAGMNERMKVLLAYLPLLDLRQRHNTSYASYGWKFTDRAAIDFLEMGLEGAVEDMIDRSVESCPIVSSCRLAPK